MAHQIKWCSVSLAAILYLYISILYISVFIYIHFGGYGRLLSAPYRCENTLSIQNKMTIVQSRKIEISRMTWKQKYLKTKNLAEQERL